MATDINTVSLTGRLTRDSELRQTNSGVSVLNFSIANNKTKRKEGDQWVEQVPNYFNIILWGRQGEVLQQYLVKGKQVAVSGRLQQRSYQTQDGSKRSVVEIVADNVLLCSGSGQAGSSYQTQQFSQPAPQPQADAAPASAPAEQSPVQKSADVNDIDTSAPFSDNSSDNEGIPF